MIDIIFGLILQISGHLYLLQITAWYGSFNDETHNVFCHAVYQLVVIGWPKVDNAYNMINISFR